MFVQREGGAERLVTEAEIVFNSGSLAGMKLVGFSIWSSPEGESWVSKVRRREDHCPPQPSVE